MDKIDINSEDILNIAKAGMEDSNSKVLREVIIKINEIIDWINTQ